MNTAPSASPSTRPSEGLWWGLCTGIVVWAAHLTFQASQTFGSLWGDFLIPALVAPIVGAVAAAVRSAHRREFWLGVAGGILITIPIVLAVLGVMLVTIDPM